MKVHYLGLKIRPFGGMFGQLRHILRRSHWKFVRWAGSSFFLRNVPKMNRMLRDDRENVAPWGTKFALRSKRSHPRHMMWAFS